MYFIIDKYFKIYDCVKEYKQVYGMVLDVLNNITASPNHQIIDFSIVDKEGFFFVRKDNEIILRKYTTSEGYMYTSLTFEEINTFYISEFDTIEVNQFVRELKEQVIKRGQIKNNVLEEMNRRRELKNKNQK